MPMKMKLAVIVPTHNRAQSLRKTLSSLTSAMVPPGMEVEVMVVDNNSSDDTAAVVEEMRPLFGEVKLQYLFEPRQGRSYAVNTGIEGTVSDLISTIDDDEQVDQRWYTEIHKVFGERWDKLDFAGGKILPNLETTPPDWVEPLKTGALCWRDFGDTEWEYHKDSPMITGAHGIFKRSVFDRIGLYNESLGVKGKGFLGGEDEVLYDQLIENGFRGVYFPNLVVYHDVPARRLTKGFYRQWLIGVGRSRRIADVHYKRVEGVRIIGIPRCMYRQAAESVVGRIKHTVRRDEASALEAENNALVFVGFFYQTHIEGTWFDRVILEAVGRALKPVSR
jgi:glycosyltransferase involved in cell wall biosynthesis